MSLGRSFFGANIAGAATADFEREFAAKMGSRHAVAISSVRFGIYHTMKIMGFPEGSEALCPPITIYPIIETLIQAGCKPVFVDIEPGDFSIDLKDAERKVSGATKLLLVTHLWGVPNRMEDILGFAKKHGLDVIEDASQCLNGTVGGKKTGTFGKAGFFSLGVTKTVCAYRGAIMVTDDPEIARGIREVVRGLPPVRRKDLIKWVCVELALHLATRRLLFSTITHPLLKLLRRAGVGERRRNSSLSKTSRGGSFPKSLLVSFSDIQAITASKMLKRLDADDERRREIAALYFRGFAGLPFLDTPRVADGAAGNLWVFAAFASEPEKLRERILKRGGIDSVPSSLDACHEMKYFDEFAARLPRASGLLHRALYLPLYPALSDREAGRVVDAVLGFSGEPGPRRQLYGIRENLRDISAAGLAARRLLSFYTGVKSGAPPVMVAWELTNACNRACPFCDTHSLGAKEGAPPLDLSLKIAEAIGEAGVKAVTLSGGEPLLSGSLIPVVKVLCRRNVKVSICTNGDALPEFAPVLRELGVNSVTIGFNALQPEAGAPGGSGKSSGGGIGEAIGYLRSGRVIVRLRFLLTPASYREMVGFADQWRGKVDEVCFQPAQDLGEGHVHHAGDGRGMFTGDMREDFTSNLNRLIAKYPEYKTPYYMMMPDFLFSPEKIRNSFRCLVPALGFKVSPNGNVTLCSEPGTPVGNLSERGVSEIWNGEEFCALREKSRRRRRDCLCWIQPVRLSFFMSRGLKPLITHDRID